MQLDCFFCITMVLEVNKCVVSFHNDTSDFTTLLKNLFKIFLLSATRDTSDIDLCEFNFTFASRTHTSSSSWALSTTMWAGTTSTHRSSTNAPSSLSKLGRVRSGPSPIVYTLFTVHLIIFWMFRGFTVFIHWLGLLFFDDFWIIALVLLRLAIRRLRSWSFCHNLYSSD